MSEVRGHATAREQLAALARDPGFPGPWPHARGDGAAPAAGRLAAVLVLFGVLDSLPAVSGSWGKGRLLSTTLLTAVITDDGRVAVGAVVPDALYRALGSR